VARNLHARRPRLILSSCIWRLRKLRKLRRFSVAHIPMDDVNTLWRDTPQHDWSAFHRTLQQHKGKVNGISDALIDLLLPIAQRFAQSRHPYPDSPQAMYDLLNEEIRALR